MKKTRGYVTPGAAGLIVFIAGSVVGTVLITAAFFAEYYRQKADVQHIGRESEMCVIRVEASCGDDICSYKTSVPCDELEALTRSSKRRGRK